MITPTCFLPSCGMALKKHRGRSHWWRFAKGTTSYGFGGNNYFCSRGCAVTWAVNKASSMDDETGEDR